MASVAVARPSEHTHSPPQAARKMSHPLAAVSTPSDLAEVPNGKAPQAVEAASDPVRDAEAQEEDYDAPSSPGDAPNGSAGWLGIGGQSTERLTSTPTRSAGTARSSQGWTGPSSSRLGESSVLGSLDDLGSGSWRDEEDQEAKTVEMNLERWAAEERQRRKALRASRSSASGGSTSSGTVGGPAGLVRRLSQLGRNKSSNAAADASLGAVKPSAGSANLLRRSTGSFSSADADSVVSDPSFDAALSSSATTYPPRANGSSLRQPGQPAIPEDAEEADDAAARMSSETIHADPVARSSSRKGKARARDDPEQWSPASPDRESANGGHRALRSEASGGESNAANPFRDPSAWAAADEEDRAAAEAARMRRISTLSIKPTAKRPIVVPGGATTIQHRAILAGAKIPSVIATDADAIPPSSSTGSSNDPFASPLDDTPSGSSRSPYSMDAGNGYGKPVRPEMARKRTSTSKFNEIGLDDDDDAKGIADDPWSVSEYGSEAQWPKSRAAPTTRQARGRHAAADDEDDEASARRRPWWSDWLCGCDAGSDLDDEEQTGRTGPE